MRAMWLLIASCYFYASFVPSYLLVLFFLITLDYCLGLMLERYTGRGRFIFLWISIAANLGVLFFFKYFNFFNANIEALATLLNWNYSYAVFSLALPLGLSFHVFQSLSYIVEIYRRKYKAERNYFTYALYVMFFPQLVAGPIERPAHLLPQLKVDHPWAEHNVVRGLERMAWGFFKKLVIADNLAHVVNQGFAHLPNDGPTLALLAILFAYQLYCDFSGYADIAVGSAMVLGFEIMENFNRPYVARSVAEFWQRWHISLSTWLRDYLYYPLVFSGRRSRARIYLSTVITFVLIGLWHGANWTFVVMGALHGMYLVVGLATEKVRAACARALGLARLPRVYRALQIIITFALVAFSFIFFRAVSIDQALYIVSHLLVGWGSAPQLLTSFAYGAGSMLGVAVVGIIAMEIVQSKQEAYNSMYVWDELPGALRVAWRYALVGSILVWGYLGAQTFIYFQF